MANQDRIIDKANEIQEYLKNTHCEHIRWTKATHWITTASYFRWHGDDKAADRLKAKNMDEFCEVRTIQRLKASRNNERSQGVELQD